MPESVCGITVQHLCGQSKTGGVLECEACAAEHMPQLASAGCTSTDVVKFCSAPPGPGVDVWSCAQCQHVYNPATDDPARKNTPFEQLPESWRCPVCGAPKSAYRKQVDSVTGVAQWFHEQ